MIQLTIQQFITVVDWGELDFLLVDLPPGTGDAQLTLVQQVPVSGGVIVTTPQDVALQDVQRGIAMFDTVSTPVLGIVENMSYYECEGCGAREDLFGHEGGRREAEALGVALLAEIPLVPALREGMDRGTPVVVGDPSSPVAAAFAAIATQVASKLAAGDRPGVGTS